ncbi:hypothetical protein BDY21DRAFT_344564 [Lineolata rhizophorae]|uniref:Uncharacterized protein n=1 Tax=Lineolata rhizophorae TaxID=578093 RepID=A0A6A6P0W7_9PEZI|nr:hypothetical protein BDY21DRAFT_344564 [Lineolata rhizophorae]
MRTISLGQTTRPAASKKPHNTATSPTDIIRYHASSGTVYPVIAFRQTSAAKCGAGLRARIATLLRSSRTTLAPLAGTLRTHAPSPSFRPPRRARRGTTAGANRTATYIPREIHSRRRRRRSRRRTRQRRIDERDQTTTSRTTPRPSTCRRARGASTRTAAAGWETTT